MQHRLSSFVPRRAAQALLEAAASGRALVTCDVPGYREVVTHNDNGLLVPARDAPALAQALKTLISDPARRARMAKRSRARAVVEFSVDQIVADTIALYHKTLRR